MQTGCKPDANRMQSKAKAVGHLLLKSFWSNEAIFQLMMLAYNLFLLFKIDFVRTTEYRQQIKTFRIRLPGDRIHCR